jgi:3-deoxy-manno-octulosonate cytidylyltransferase (CMP-KDO synthetase)
MVTGVQTCALPIFIELQPADLEIWESLEQLRWLHNGFKIQVVQTEIETPNIDTPEDVAAVLALL